MALKIKNKLAVGAGLSAAVIASVLACTLPTKPTKPTGPAVNVAHVSQERINGDIAFVEISAAHYVSDRNPKGWGHPHYSAIEREGFITPAIIALLDEAARDGKTIFAMWEPSCQHDPGQLAQTQCMAWMNAELAARCWSPIMQDTWPMLLTELSARNMRPMWYLGCAGHHLSTIVDDLAFAKAMGVDIIGLDAFSWTVHVDPPRAQKVVEAIRADPRTKDLTLVTEGWLPVELKGPQRAFFLRHLVQLDLARGGTGKLAASDSNWTRMDGLPLDQKIVKGCRGIVLMHGSNWESGDLEATYDRAAAAGLFVCDYRAKPKRSPRRSRRTRRKAGIVCSKHRKTLHPSALSAHSAVKGL